MRKKDRDKACLSVLLIQMASGEDPLENKQQMLSELARHSMDDVDLVIVPEMFNYRMIQSSAVPANLMADTMVWLSDMAKDHGVYVIAGSMIETGGDRYCNTTWVLDDGGRIVESYRKMHLFDAVVAGVNMGESNRFLAGNAPKCVSIYGWCIGLSICYDIRFPELYRHYFLEQVDAVVIPSSFTYETGAKHWEVLCRARAIENQCYVVAPNQSGVGARGVRTYGRSLAVDPDGLILACCDETGVSSVRVVLDKGVIATVRSRIPVKKHCRLSNLSLT